MKFSLHAKDPSEFARVEPAILAFVSLPGEVRAELHRALVAHGAELERAIGRHPTDLSGVPIAGVRFRSSVEVQYDSDGTTYCLLSGEGLGDEEHSVQVAFAGGTRIVRVSDQDGHLRDPSIGGTNPFAVSLAPAELEAAMDVAIPRPR